MADSDATDSANADDRVVARPRYSLATLLMLLLVVALGSAYALTARRLLRAESELQRLRVEVGYLAETPEDHVAATRVISDEPMTFRLRVRVPESPRYRIAYSSLWPKEQTAPTWYAAVPVPPGESTVIVRVLKDPRDENWKITALRRNVDSTRRVATVLPPEHVTIFRGSHDWLSVGVSRQTASAASGNSLRLLDERVLVDGSRMLYGDRAPESDLIGIFAELQPDVGPL